ncbi:nuclear transport factor 2 family protein [Frankia sp. AgPm24]|uniref:nuclear transport factor 2 family protein n=1 Tax=Frankia sp. AgPm24 TaxID=631128 RepID=UPI00200DA9F0|nr:nuclear transport factor 2 family protein [Frankia sp. AgPm24]MCK9921951.1 nuclear transport factor 2 family protein [Frankia sp. AgPm24]
MSERISDRTASLNHWIDTAEITQVVNRYFRALDERVFDASHLGRIFTAGAGVIRPNGTQLTGPAAIGDGHRESLARFESTQHLLTGHDVIVAGDNATLRANLVAMHLWDGARKSAGSAEDYFVAGSVITVRLQLTPQGWKITELVNDTIWRAGSGFTAMAHTGRPTS